MINKYFSFLLAISFCISVSAQLDTTSYSVGMIMAKSLKSQGITEITEEAFMQGLNDFLKSGNTVVNLSEANARFNKLAEQAQLKMHEENKIAGEKFLTDNAKKEGVMTTPSGLQYSVLTPSDNPAKPVLSDKVKVHYHGTLTDGTVFDSSVDRGEPISFPLANVITGWQEGLQLMNVGSKYRLYIPYDLAYGSRAAGPTIKPYSALVFDVTLLAIE